MIKEAYVSFEVAKLLNEKGFDWNTQYVYTLDGTGSTPHKIGNWRAKSNIQKPTHQMVMKWLREVHHIAINIGWGEVFEEQYKWWCIILNMDNGNILCDTNCHASYEEAVEQSIKYVLEHVI